MDRFGNKSVSEVREINFKVKHLSDPGQPVNIPNLGDVYITYNNIIWFPEQSKYVNDLVIFYDDPATLGETFVFVPALRRSLRLSSAARCSPLVGSDYTADDERSMSIQPPIFQAKFLGYKKLLVSYPKPELMWTRPITTCPCTFPAPKPRNACCAMWPCWISGAPTK